MPHDEELFRWIDLANIACGGHAGGMDEMRRAVDFAATYGVAVGAHPSYPDRENFGRKSVIMEPDDIQNVVTEQVAALSVVCQEAGQAVTYVKPHGALYHDMMAQLDVFEAILRAVSSMPHVVPVMVLAGAGNRQVCELAKRYSLPLLFEAFADRVYTNDGKLAGRSLEGSVLTSIPNILDQVMQIVNGGQVTTLGGDILELKADTICVHGDNEASIAAVREIYHMLKS